MVLHLAVGISQNYVIYTVLLFVCFVRFWRKMFCLSFFNSSLDLKALHGLSSGLSSRHFFK